ncbi:MAG: hypothetical protein ACYSUA_17410 [Planctomycetota bacterium]
MSGSVESLQLTVTSAGHEITGGMSSTIVMVWTQVAVLSQMSLTLHVRTMTMGQSPETLSDQVGSPVRSLQLSVAVA